MAKLDKIITDVNAKFQPEGSYRWALNKMQNRKYSGISDEIPISETDIFQERIDYIPVILKTVKLNKEKEIIFSLHIPKKDFLYKNISEIGVLDKFGNYNTIVADENLSFDEFSVFNAEVIPNFDGTHSLLWSDGKTTAKILNIENPEISIGSDYKFKNPQNIELLNFFLSLNPAILQSISINDFGGSLKSGNYNFAFAYQLEDGTQSDFSLVSNSIPITNSIAVNGYNNYEGSDSDIVTSKSIKLNISKVDKRFNNIVIAVIKTINGSSSAEIIAKLSINNRDNIFYTYTGNEKGEPIPLERILIKSANYTSQKTFSIHNNSIYFGNLSTMKYAGQEEALDIKVSYVFEDDISLDGVKGSYKDGATVFLKKSFMPGEVVPLYISWLLNDNSFTPAYHIPGREAKVIEGITLKENAKTKEVQTELNLKTPSSGNYLNEDLQISTDIKYFHTRDNNLVYSEMAYWENEELYPKDFPKLAGTPVRHHKFPSLSTLSKISPSGNFITVKGTGANSLLGTLTADGKGSDGTDIYFNELFGFSVSDATVNVVRKYDGTWKERSVDLVISAVKDITIDISHAFQMYSYRDGGTSSIYANVHMEDKNGKILRVLKEGRDIDNSSLIGSIVGKRYTSSVTLDVSEQVALKSGESLHFFISYAEYFYTNSFKFNLKLNVLDTALKDKSNIEGSVFSKALGIKLSNIRIPKQLIGKVKGFTILYAKRDINNSLVKGIGMAFQDDAYTYRVHFPDLLANKAIPSINTTYIRKEAIVDVTTSKVDINKQNYSSDSGDILVVKSANYLPHDLVTKKEAAYVIRTINSNAIVTDSIPYISIVSLQLNAYQGFDSQKLISTGVFFDKNTAETPTLYGGDTYINSYAVRLTPDTTTNRKIYNYVTFSAINAGLRQEGKDYGEQYYPKHNIPESFGAAPSGMDENSVDNYIKINYDFSKLNEFIGIFPYKVTNKNVFKFPNRIIKTDILKSEGKANDVRRVLPASYYEVDRNRGEIINLQNIGNEMIIHTTETLYKTVGNIRLSNNSQSDITITGGSPFAVKPEELFYTDRGIAGTKFPESCAMHIPGYMFVNTESNSLFIIRNDLKNFAANGNLEYFRRKLPLEFLKQYKEVASEINPIYTHSRFSLGYIFGYDYEYNRILFTKRDFITKTKKPVLQEYPLKKASLTFNGIINNADGHIAVIMTDAKIPEQSKELEVVIDNITYTVIRSNDKSATVAGAPDFLIIDFQNVLLNSIGKTVKCTLNYYTPKNNSFYYLYDGVVYDENKIPLGENHPDIIDRSITLSFDSSGNLISEHTYKPSIYFNVGNKLFSFIENKIYKHNSYEKPISLDSFIDVVIPFKGRLSRLSSVMWVSDAYTKDGIYLEDKTVSSIQVYNSTQISAEIVLKPRIKGIKGVWAENKFDNRALKIPFISDDFVIDNSSISNVPIDNTNIIRFFDTYIIIRLKNTEIEKNYVILYDVFVKTT